MLKQFFLAGSLLASTFAFASAKDYYLTIGGGYSPAGNQVSLEKNVLLFQSYLESSHTGEYQHDIFFADGTAAGRDLQFVTNENDIPKLNRLLASVFQQSRDMGLAYRTNAVGGLQGSASRQNLNDWFEKTGKSLTPNDRLFIYVTAHGGKAISDKQKFNTRLHLWNQEIIDVGNFVEMLDKVDVGVPITMVMVQCYSGGFANSIFESGNPEKEIARPNRVGFFATVHDRVAAGCTPDTKEDDYHEYTTYLMEALRGKKRNGEKVVSPDYNNDGFVSLDEAHVYALTTSTTIDVSIRSSDAYLRAKSKVGSDTETDLVSLKTPISQLLAEASSHEKKIIEELSLQLCFSEEDRVSEAQAWMKKLDDKIREVGQERNKATQNEKRAADAIKNGLLNQWPELANRWNPTGQTILTNEGLAIERFIESHPQYQELVTAKNDAAAFAKESMDYDREKTRCDRLIYAIETLVRSINLKRVGTPEQQAHFARLRERESVSPLNIQPPTVAAKNPSEAVAEGGSE